VKHFNFDLIYSISFFSRFVFDAFIAKWGEYVHKVGRTLTNQVVKRRNMINIYLRRRVCIESVRGSLSLIQEDFDFELFFVFSSVCWLSCHLLVLWLFLLLDDLLKLFFGIRSSSYASWSLGFKIQTLCFLLSIYSSRGRLRNQVVSTFV
jgi:hypothetical protein